MFDLVLKGGHVFHTTPDKSITCIPLDIGIKDEKILSLEPPLSDKISAKETLNIQGLYVLPGCIDSHVHFREPGFEYKEDFGSGTRAAALGGITCVFDMPNTKPSTIDQLSLRKKQERVKGRAWCDYAFYLAATKDNLDVVAKDATMPGCCGIKLFMGCTTGGLLVSQDDEIEILLKNAKKEGVLVAVHAEDEKRLQERKSLIRPGYTETHPLWRDPESALLATKRVVSLARKCQTRIHILHVSTKEEVAFLKDNQDVASFEITPQHLTLCAPECYETLGTRAQMNPPIRTLDHQEALWSAIKEMQAHTMGSDHAPHTLDEKAAAYPESPSGLPGVQTLLPLMLNFIRMGKLSLERLVSLTSFMPAKLFGLENKGMICEGYDADLTIVDLQKDWCIDDAKIASRCGWSPFSGMTGKGSPVGTIVRGHIVMWQGCLRPQKAIGRNASFKRVITRKG